MTSLKHTGYCLFFLEPLCLHTPSAPPSPLRFASQLSAHFLFCSFLFPHFSVRKSGKCKTRVAIKSVSHHGNTFRASPHFLSPNTTDSSSRDILKLNQLHTHTHPLTVCPRVTAGLSTSISLPLPAMSCPHLSHCDPVASLALAFNLAVIQMHPSLSLCLSPHTQSHTHEQTCTQRWIFCQDSLRPIRLRYWSMARWRPKAIRGPKHNEVLLFVLES